MSRRPSLAFFAAVTAVVALAGSAAAPANAGTLAQGASSSLGVGASTLVREEPDPDCPDDGDTNEFDIVDVDCYANRYYVPSEPTLAHKFDVFTPIDAANAPAVILIHGGGWDSGDTSAFYDEAAYFAQNGLAAFTINYELAAPGDPSWPQNINDIRAARDYIAANGALFGADGSRIAVFGGSAGGHLAALLSVTSDDDPNPPAEIVTSVTWSGGMAITGNYDGPDAGDEPDHVPFAQQEQMIGCPYEDDTPFPTDESCPEKYVAASPYEHVEGTVASPAEPTMLIFNSTNENVDISAANRMGARLTNRGVRNRVVPITDVDGTWLNESLWHAAEYECVRVTFNYQDGGPTYTNKVVEHTARWLKRELFNDPTRTLTHRWDGDCPHPNN